MTLLDPEKFTANSIISRYMPVRTFLSCLESRILWMPTVASFRGDDAREGRRPSNLWDERFFSPSVRKNEKAIRNWVETHGGRMVGESPIRAAGLDWDVVARQYAEMLSRRRAVSCWFLSDHESNPMWMAYGDRGTGIRVTTTVGRLLSAASIHPGLIAAIRYVDFDQVENNGFNRHTPDDTAQALLDRAWLRPYLLKDIGYQAENEVRLVVPVETHGQGRALPMDWKELFTEVRVAKSFHPTEYEALKIMLVERYEIDASIILRSRLAPPELDGGGARMNREWTEFSNSLAAAGEAPDGLPVFVSALSR